MKVLKTALCIISALIFSLPPTVSASAAQDGRTYAQIQTDSVYFCSEMNLDTALFALPYTYCVRILADHGEWYLIEYAEDDGFYESLTGYCLKEGLAVVDTPPENLYLNYPVLAVLQAGVPNDGSLPGLEIAVTVAYYGILYHKAKAYSYVRYEGAFRYIPGAFDDYPLNDLPSQPTFTENPATFDEGNSRLITAVIICAIAASALVIAFLSGKKRNTGIKNK